MWGQDNGCFVHVFLWLAQAKDFVFQSHGVIPFEAVDCQLWNAGSKRLISISWCFHWYREKLAEWPWQSKSKKWQMTLITPISMEEAQSTILNYLPCSKWAALKLRSAPLKSYLKTAHWYFKHSPIPDSNVLFLKRMVFVWWEVSFIKWGFVMVWFEIFSAVHCFLFLDDAVCFCPGSRISLSFWHNSCFQLTLARRDVKQRCHFVY